MELDSIAVNLKDSFLRNFNLLVEQVPNIILSILIVSLGSLLATFLTTVFKKTVSRKVDDTLMVNFLSKLVKMTLVIIVVMFALKVAGLDGIATGILTTAGASAVIFGFAFRDIGENFISGVILSFKRPFHIDDTVSIGDIFGKVKAMEFRYTKLKTFDGRDVYIPNSDLIKKAVFNYTEDGFFRLDFIVGVAYEEKISDVEELILKTIRSTDGVIEDETHETFVTADELATSTVNLRVYFWVETTDYRKQSLKIKSDVVANVKQAIIENGMNMPAEIKEIKLYGSQTSIPIIVKKEE